MHIVHLLESSLCICSYITLHYSSNILLQIEEVFAFSNFCLYIIWKLIHKEGWASKNWCFWIVVLEKTLERPLDCKEMQPVHSEGDQPWVFFGRNDAKAETPVLWPPHVKSWLIGKDSDAGRDWGQEEKGWQRMRWLDGITDWLKVYEFEQTLGDSGGQRSLACCSPWDRRKSDMP